jgi:hypothetical protein
MEMSNTDKTEEGIVRGVLRIWWTGLTTYAKSIVVLAVAGIALILMILTVQTAVSAVSGSSSDTSYSANSTSDYLADVRAHVYAPNYSDSNLVTIGNSACRAETRDNANAWATSMVRSGTMDYYSANYIHQAALAYLCVEVPA